MRAFLALAIVAAPTAAFADTLVLQDGQTFEGVVVERGDQVEVRLDFGTVAFSRSEVKAILRSKTKLHELNKRTARLGARDLNGTLALARWAAKNNLGHGARELYRAALRIDPRVEEAHRALGHKKHDGRWLSPDEYRVARGEVLWGGRWVSADEARALDAEAENRRERRRAERAEAKDEREARQADFERQQLDARIAALESDQLPPPLYFNWAFTGFGWVPGQNQTPTPPGYRPVQRSGTPRSGRSPVFGLPPLHETMPRPK